MSKPPMAGRLSVTAERGVAILLLSIDEKVAAEIMRSLSDDNLDSVTRAMKELSEVSVDRTLVDVVFQEFANRMQRGGMALGDVTGVMDRILVSAFGDERGADVSKRASNDILVRKPFSMFESLPPEDLANLLFEEHPQIAAVFMAHLDRSKAGKVLRCMDEDRRADVVHRVATLDRTPPEVVQRVLEVMRRKVRDLGLATLRSEPKVWVKAAADILNHMGGGEKDLLESIAVSDEAIASEIRDEMFTFDDLSNLDKKAMQKVLSQVDSRVLALAMRAATRDVEDNVFGNLSARAADMVKEERETLGPTPLSEVVEAQQEILLMVRDLMDKGEVAAGVGEEQMV